MSRLRARCAAFLRQLGEEGRDPVEEMVCFVTAERGRRASRGDLDDWLPVCLYFRTPADRDGFFADLLAAPGVVTRTVP